MKKRIRYEFIIVACLLIALPGTVWADGSAVPKVTSATIYANGVPLIIADGGQGDDGATTVYIDGNGNGIIDTDDQSLSEAGVSGAPADGADLSSYVVFGGCSSTTAYEGNTKITMLGGTVRTIYGGSSHSSAAITGNTSVTISGGTVRDTIYGGGGGGSIYGNTSVTISAGKIGKVFGGGRKSAVNGDTEVTISGGKFSIVYGGGYDPTALVSGSTAVTVSGGSGIAIHGGGDEAAVSGSTRVTFSGGTVLGVIGGGSASTATVGADSTVVITKDAVVIQTAKGGGFNAETVSGDISLTVAYTTEIREGYTFEDWFTDSKKQTPVAYTSEIYTTNADIELYTKWVTNTFTVLFEGNSSTGGSMSGQDFLYDEYLRLDKTQFTKEHIVTYEAQGGTVTPEKDISSCKFLGWADSKSGDKQYDDQEWVANLTSDNNGTVTLYAVWDDTYAPVTLPTPARTGYSFSGWYAGTQENEVKAGDGGDSYTPETSLVLYAHWTANEYAATFDPEDGSVSPITKNVTYGSPYGTLPVLTKSGVNFAGWWTGTDGIGTQITAESIVATADNHTLYARWTDKVVISIAATTQSYRYDGTAKAFAISGIESFDGVSSRDFSVIYSQDGDESMNNVLPVNPGNYNVIIIRSEDDTYSEFRITIPNGLVIDAAAIDIATISGVAAPVRGAIPASTSAETAQYTGVVTWTPSVQDTFAASTEYTATITLTPKTGYTTKDVTADFFILTGAVSCNNDAASGVITAVFPATDEIPTEIGGSSSGRKHSDATRPATDVTADVTSSSGRDSTLPVIIDANGGTAFVNIGSNNLTRSGTTITIPSIPEVNAYTFGIPLPALSAANEHVSMILNTNVGSVSIPPDMLTGIAGINKTNAEITIGPSDKSALPDGVKSSIGSKPVIQLSLAINGKKINWSNPNAPVKISIPYTPTEKELAHPEAIVIWYIDGGGNVISVPNGRYEAATGTVSFSTTHFSDYAVAYNKVSFNDVFTDAWYHDAVSFIAARKITAGTGSKNYNPKANLTRGEFLVLMMRAYEIEPNTNPTENFSDAGDTYYTGYLSAAKQLGITSGIGDNMYAPGNQITRQEMFTLLYNVLNTIGELPQDDTGKVLSDFADIEEIAPWAIDAMTYFVDAGTVEGNGGRLAPTGTTSRAEMAQVLYYLLSK